MIRLTAAAAFIAIAACSPVGVDVKVEHEAAALPDLGRGSHEMLRAPIVAAPGYEVIVSDVVIPAGAVVPKHTHPGEEFLYVIQGSAIHREDGKDDHEVKAGEAMVIAPGAAHSPIGGEAGARAIVFRVHKTGEPERTLVDHDN